MGRLCLVLLLLLLAGCSLDLPGATRPAVAHAATYVVGGKKGWAGVKGWTADLSPNDVLVFKWGNRALDGLFGPKHSVAIPKSLASLNTCNTKDVEKMVVKPTRKAKKSYTLGPINPPRFFSTVGKDCKNGIKFSLGL